MACDESHAMRPSFYDSSSPFFSAIVVARHLSLSLSLSVVPSKVSDRYFC